MPAFYPVDMKKDVVNVDNEHTDNILKELLDITFLSCPWHSDKHAVEEQWSTSQPTPPASQHPSVHSQIYGSLPNKSVSYVHRNERIMNTHVFYLIPSLNKNTVKLHDRSRWEIWSLQLPPPHQSLIHKKRS